MSPQYSCLGCEYCFPTVAQNTFAQAFPSMNQVADLSCEFRIRDEAWPPLALKANSVDQI